MASTSSNSVDILGHGERWMEDGGWRMEWKFFFFSSRSYKAEVAIIFI